MTMYLIGIGGTGAKCIEAVVKLASVGLFTEKPLKLFFIDADETNGNLERSTNSLKTHSKCYEIVSGGDKELCPWMKTPVESFGLWSPFTGDSTNKELRSFFNYNNIQENQPALGGLFDVLYTKEEQEVGLEVGFRGRPAIGAAVMSQVDLNRLDEDPWGSVVRQIQQDVSSGTNPTILLCGSIFGGTGASGLPTIGRLIVNRLNSLNVRDRINIGCLFMLPYFGFTPPVGEDPDGIYARSEQFLLNTEAALRYYRTQAQRTFDTVFLLGNQNFSQVEFSIGKNTQKNDPHFLELYAALAARHFLLKSEDLKGKVVMIGRKDLGRITWDDIPDVGQIKPALVRATIFAYSWLTEIEPELKHFTTSSDSKIVLAPWLLKFFPSKKGEGIVKLRQQEQKDAIKVINDWCEDYLQWLGKLHREEGEEIRLFTRSNILNSSGKGLPKEKLSELVYGEKISHTILKLKRSLQEYKGNSATEGGIVGLAKTLYILCKIN